MTTTHSIESFRREPDTADGWCDLDDLDTEFVDEDSLCEENSCRAEDTREQPDGGLPVTELVELILKDRRRLHRLIRRSGAQPELIPKLLAISLAGFVFYGLAMAIVLNAAGVRPELAAVGDWLGGTATRLIRFVPLGEDVGLVERWLHSGTFIVPAVYSLGLIAATGVCLPSLYFYSLLSGVRMSMLDVTIHALKSKATSAVALVGILPVYLAIGMAAVVFDVPPPALESTLFLGLILPFIAGLWGSYSLYDGLGTLCDTLPAERRNRRACFLRRLVFSWCACYTAVAPVMIFTLWEAMS